MEKPQRRHVSKGWGILRVILTVSAIAVFWLALLVFSPKCESGIHVINVQTNPYIRNLGTTGKEMGEEGYGLVGIEGRANVTVTLHNYDNADVQATIVVYAEDAWITGRVGTGETHIDWQVTDYEVRTVLAKAKSDVQVTSNLKGCPFGNIHGRCQILEVNRT